MNKSALLVFEHRLMRSLISLFLVGLSASPLLARSPVTSSARKVPTVLVLGDSLSAGYGLRRADAFPALLSQKAAAYGLRVRIVNAGVTGGTTAGGLQRLPSLLRHHVDVILIELGINDAFRGVPVPQIEANLQAIIDRARDRYPAVQVVIAGMQLPRYSNGDYVSAFGSMYVQLAQRNHAGLVPFLLEGVAGNPQLNLPDLIHPNVSGQKILAANVWPALESALKKADRS